MDQFMAALLKRPDEYPDWDEEPDLRAALDWFRSFLPEADWQERRRKAARRLYSASVGLLNGPEDRGRFFAEDDTFGWYMFLADAALDHIWNYDPTFGARVIPIFKGIGRNLDLLKNVANVDVRVRRLVTSDRRQPNGGLFELLVAAAYCRTGASVSFVMEKRGGGKTHDLDVELAGHRWAVECKRLEMAEYDERERAEARRLWHAPAAFAVARDKSLFADVTFKVELTTVPNDYLLDKAQELFRGGRPAILWNDDIAYGAIGEPDLKPLQDALKETSILTIGSRTLALLAGSYVRNANYVLLARAKAEHNPRFMDECDLAVLLRWKNISVPSLEARARDIRKRLADAVRQLPPDVPGIIHIGFETVEDDFVEDRRYEKVMATVRTFEPTGTNLETVFVHYFVPESPPTGSWAFDETTLWWGTKPEPAPLDERVALVLPRDAVTRPGMHWDTPEFSRHQRYSG